MALRGEEVPVLRRRVQPVMPLPTVLLGPLETALGVAPLSHTHTREIAHAETHAQPRTLPHRVLGQASAHSTILNSSDRVSTLPVSAAFVPWMDTHAHTHSHTHMDASTRTVVCARACSRVSRGVRDVPELRPAALFGTVASDENEPPAAVASANTHTQTHTGADEHSAAAADSVSNVPDLSFSPSLAHVSTGPQTRSRKRARRLETAEAVHTHTHTHAHTGYYEVSGRGVACIHVHTLQDDAVALERCISGGGEPDMETIDGDTCLMLACRYDARRAAAVLLARRDARFSVHKRNAAGQTPFMLAVASGNVEVAQAVYRVLQANEASAASLRKDLLEAFEAAVSMGHVDVVNWIVQLPEQYTIIRGCADRLLFMGLTLTPDMDARTVAIMDALFVAGGELNERGARLLLSRILDTRLDVPLALSVVMHLAPSMHDAVPLHLTASYPLGVSYLTVALRTLSVESQRAVLCHPSFGFPGISMDELSAVLEAAVAVVLHKRHADRVDGLRRSIIALHTVGICPESADSSEYRRNLEHELATLLADRPPQLDVLRLKDFRAMLESQSLRCLAIEERIQQVGRHALSEQEREEHAKGIALLQPARQLLRLNAMERRLPILRLRALRRPRYTLPTPRAIPLVELLQGEQPIEHC